MAGQRRYKAFISYSHHDERWARWLHRSLETYRLPRALSGGRLGTFGERPLRPVFRDRDELSASRNLSAKIQEALAESNSLVVICSRNAAASQWVNAEIEEFRRLGRDEQIYCLFVGDGPPQECLPEALSDDLDVEPLGADLQRDGKLSARLKLCAGLLGVHYDTLRQRDRERRRQQVLGISLGAAFAFSVVSFVTYRVTTLPPCANSGQVFAQVWNAQRDASIKQAFLAAGVPFSDHTVKAVLETLSTYARRWIDMHREACEATMVRGEQSQQLMDLRMACLIEGRHRFDALARQFLNGDFNTVTNAVQAASGLGTLSRCADRSALLAAYPPPVAELA